MWSQQKHISAIVANFSPGRYDVDKTRHTPIKLQNQSISGQIGQINFGTQLQTFQKKCNTRNFIPKT